MVRPQIERNAFLGGIGRPVIHDGHASDHFRQRQGAGAFSGMKEAANQGGLLRGSTALNGIDARTERPQAAFLKADPHT